MEISNQEKKLFHFPFSNIFPQQAVYGGGTAWLGENLHFIFPSPLPPGGGAFSMILTLDG
jgi:hypothetical protein